MVEGNIPDLILEENQLLSQGVVLQEMEEFIVVDLVMGERGVMGDQEEIMNHKESEDTQEEAMVNRFQEVYILDQALKLVVDHQRIVQLMQEKHLV